MAYVSVFKQKNLDLRHSGVRQETKVRLFLEIVLAAVFWRADTRNQTCTWHHRAPGTGGNA